MNLIYSLTGILSGNKSVGMMSRFFRHLVAGGIGTLIYVTLVAILVEIFGLHPVPSVMVAVVIEVLYKYIISRGWVYQPDRTNSYTIPRFLVVVIISLLLNTGIMYFAVEIIQLWYVWGLLSTAFIVPPTNFLLNFYWTFR